MADPITKPCLIEDMAEDTYHADPVEGGSLSYTGMKELLKSPAHFRHYMDAPRVEKPVFDAGHIVHAPVLGTDLNVAVIPDGILASNGAATTKAAKEFIAGARLDGLIPVKSHEMGPHRDIADAVLAYEPARTLFEADGPTELSMFAPDPASGVWIRGRADKVATIDGETLLVDLKTCLDAEPNAFNRQSMAKFQYYLQAVVYSRLYSQITGTPAPEMRFVAVTKTAPHLVSVNTIDWAYEDLGEKAMREAITRYKAGMETGVWPGYPEELNTLTPPAYLIYDQDEEIEI